jgi:hypothetical protein
MTSARWQQIKDVLADAVECADPKERLALIQERCRTDSTLAVEVQGYLTPSDIDDEVFIRLLTAGLPRLRLTLLPVTSAGDTTPPLGCQKSDTNNSRASSGESRQSDTAARLGGSQTV